MKKCQKCHEAKPADQFYKKKSSSDGLESYCKACEIARVRLYQSSIREKKLAYQREFRARPENREKARLYRLEYRKSHLSEISARGSRYYRNNTEKRRRYISAWHKNNLWRSRAAYNRRRSLKKKNGGHFDDVQWEEMKSKYEYKCLACGEADVELVRDHIVPLSRGGADSYENIQPLCRRCNAIKSTKTIDYRPK